jgi:uncharacterized cupredoxin-like copper-binding protein
MCVPRALVAAPLLGLLALAGCGATTNSPPAADGTGPVIDVTMVDNAYQPAQISIRKGQTVTLRFKNTGTAAHEAVIGDPATQTRHETEMTANPGAMDHGSATAPATASDAAITIEPGRTGDLTHTFTESGPLLIGCHEPTHWAAGMKATITTI